MTADQSLAHALKIRFGLAPNEPSPNQLQGIKTDIQEIITKNEKVSDIVWAKIVSQHCHSFGKYGYHGIDNSDLRALLALAIQNIRS